MRVKGKFPILFLAVLLLASCFVLCAATGKAAAVSSRTITVPDDFATIKEAVDNANAGDTVYVKAGTYNITEQGFVSFYSFVCLSINQPISFVGEDCQNTIIMASGYYPLPFNVGIRVMADDVTISGFTIVSNWQVVSLSGNNIVLTNCIIRQTLNSAAVGVAANNSLITSNVIEGTGHGDGVFAGSNTTISNNIIRNLDAGITSYSYDFNQIIVDNTIANNSVGLKGLTVPALFRGNNILNCSQYSLTLGTSKNVDASNNYWGTTDEAVIAASIYDHKTDSSLGTVSFTPFLTSLNTGSGSLLPEVLPYYLTVAIVIAVALVVVFLERKRHTPVR